MKRFLTCFLSVTLAAVMAFGFAGCFGGGDDEPDEKPVDTTPKEYVIQYTDDSGVHKINVTDGLPYSLDVIPAKTGYTFMGLFDAEIGGTQYVSAAGSSLSPFEDGKSLVLYPLFKANQYTVILDYQGAAVTGDRQLTVEYDSSLPNLPANLALANKDFTGWYTEPDCGGVQVADEYGLLPSVSVLNAKNFDISGSSIRLYAGFEAQKYTVTCYFGSGIASEKLEIGYGTPVKEVVPKTRVDGKAPLTWSQTPDGAPFTGNIENNMTLYALEYAPVIDFDVNGGKELTPLVQRAGTTLALPTPVKDLSKFTYWEDARGNKYEKTVMPDESITLKAVWQAKLVFDENGGSDVDDISVKAGETIALPTPEKEGFVFAGWYTADKEQYTSTKMPATGVALKAGWYKAKVQQIVVKAVDESEAYSAGMDSQGETKGPAADWRREADLSKYIPANGARVHIEMHLKMRTNQAKDITEAGFYLYDGSVVSDANFLAKITDTVSSTTAKNYVFNCDVQMRSNILYLCYYSKKLDSSTAGWTKTYYGDIWFNLTYPDTTNLYL